MSMRMFLSVLTARIKRNWIIIIGTFGVLMVASASPAAAAGKGDGFKLDGCTSVRLLEPMVVWISDNVTNPVRAYGKWVLVIMVIIAIAASAFTKSKGSDWWARVAWIVVLIVVGMNLVSMAAGSGATNCLKVS